MRLFRIALSALFVLVTALFLFTNLREKASGKDIGPTISCPQEVLELSVSDGEDLLLSGITAEDKQDGDLTDHILIQGTSRQIADNTVDITYLVFDSDGNMTSATRTIRYTDYESPRFVIPQALVYNSTSAIALLDRLNAQDCIDGDITGNIRVGSLVQTNDSDIYTTEVQVTNSFSDTARLTLPIVVYASTGLRPVITLSEYLVYLDQGAAFNPRSYLKSVTTAMGQLLDTADIQIEGSVTTDIPGTYTIIYRYPYEGATGLTALTVVVE